MSVGVLTFNRFNGQEQFTISEAVILLYDNDGFSTLSFEIETDEKPLKTLPDTESLRARPNAEFTVRVTDFSWENLVGKCFEIPQGYDDETEEYLTCLYYCEHEATDNNVIKILGREADRFRVKIEATCIDVNYYDGSKPLTKVEIDAWFNPQRV